MLKRGDKVGIISPSSFVDKENILAGIEYLKSLGLEPILGKNIFKEYRWMAGTPKQRAEDINFFFNDVEIKAIFCSCGGAGSQKVLDYIDYKIIKSNHKPLFGFSDNTALQLAIYTKTGNISYTGFSLKYDFKAGKIDGLVKQSLSDIIRSFPQKIKSGKTVIRGKSRGVLLGGCLSLLRNLAGTKYYPDLNDKILLIEDVGEKTYKIDLMLEQIKQNPKFKKLKGIIFGTFADMEISDPKDGNIDDVIEYFCQDLKIPVIKNFAYGHITSRYILPIGKEITLDADKCEISF